MPDRVRESVFSILGSMLDTPGALPPIEVADVFAGSGSMGLEALSRGARRCRFFERGRAALDALTRNLQTLQAGEAASVSRKNAWVDAAAHEDGTPFDLVLLDPPYADSDDPSESGPVWRLLGRLLPCETGTQMVVLHHRAKVSFDEPQDPMWRVVDQRKIGSNGITILAR